MCLRISLKIPKIESIMLFYFFTMTIWRDSFFTHLPGGWVLTPLILWCLISLTLIKKYKKLGQYVDVFIFYIIIFGLFWFKFWGNDSMRVWLTRTYGVMNVITWGGIYSYVVIRLQDNIQDILNTLKKTGIVLYIYYAWRALEVIRNGFWTYTQFDIVRRTKNNMSWSYGVLMAICFISIYFLVEKKRWTIIPICLGILGILIYGSRGTLICILLGIFLLFITYNDGKMKFKNYFILFSAIGMGILILTDTGLMTISGWLENFGVSSRFLESLINFSLSNFEETSNGRWLIWTTVVDMIQNGPFYGYGVFGERNIIYNIGMKWGYSHNVFLELLVSFGWLIGSIIIVISLISIIRFLVKTKEKEEKLLFVIIMTMAFELLLSNTLWLHFAPWALIALYVNHFKGKSRKGSRKYSLKFHSQLPCV